MYASSGSQPTVSSVSDNKSETWVACSGCSNTTGATIATYYVLSSTAAVTSITVNASKNVTVWDIHFQELSDGGVTAYVDNSGKVSDAACNSCAGVSLSLYGTSDAIIQYAYPSNAITAISGGAGYTAFFDEDWNGAAAAGAMNTNVGTAPTWTQSGGSATIIGSAIAFTAPSGPSFVQACGNINASSTTTNTCTMSTAVTAGHTLVKLSTYYGTNTITVDGDSGSVTTVLSNTELGTSGWWNTVQVICSASGGETVIGDTLASATSVPVVEVVELFGAPSSGCVDTSNTAALGSSTTPTSNSITPAANSEMILGLIPFQHSTAPTITAGTNVSWTIPTGGVVYSASNGYSEAVEYYSQPTAASIDATATLSVSSSWGAFILAIK
jgi:hypothetical protein